MSPDLFTHFVREGLHLLPAPMNTARARAQLVTIALQESGLTHRRQMHGGPARSYFQFERIGIAGVLMHPASARHAARLCALLDVPATVDSLYVAIEWSDVLATGLARLNLLSSPRPLPASDAPEEGWREYLSVWRPGKPHRATWDTHFATAWMLVNSGEDV